MFDINTNPLRLGNRLTNQREQLKAYVDWVYAAASAIAQDAATIDLKAYANRSGKPNGKIANQLVYYPRAASELFSKLVRSPDGVQRRALEELDHHIILDLLDSPNPVQDGDSFKEFVFLHLVLAGEAFIYKVKSNIGKPVQLWPMMPYQMKENVVGQEIVNWTYRVGAQDITFTTDEIIHIKLTDPNSLYRGTGVVKAAARSINTGAAASDWNERFFVNSARPDLALHTDTTLTADTTKRLKEQWEDNYKGTSNSHKVAVLEQGLKVAKITATQKEMDFLESMKFNRDQQLAMFKTSRTMLGIVESDGRSNMEAAEYNQAKRVIRPLDRRLVAAINASLAPDCDPKLVIGFTDPVPEDKEFLHRKRVESVNVYRTINEVREEEGLEPIEGGDVLYQTATLVPLGTPSPATPDEPPTEEDDPEGEKSLPKSSAS
jgi:HK97 family phage portal protein